MSQTEYQEKPANSGWRGASSWMQNRALDIEGLAGLPLPSILIRWAAVKCTSRSPGHRGQHLHVYRMN